jgi:uncharacterized protein
MAFWRYAFFALFFWGSTGTASAQAIDCARNDLNHSERTVCASAPLHALAIGMDKRYARVLNNAGVKQSQSAWIDVRDRCNGNLACLTTAYRERSAYLAKSSVDVAPKGRSAAAAPSMQNLFLRHAPAQLLASSSGITTAEAGASARLDRAAGPAAPVISQAPHWNTLWFVGGVLFVSVLLWQTLTNVCGKCPNCHHWFARVEIDRRRLASAASTAPLRRRLRLRSRALASPLPQTNASHERKRSVRHFNQCRICLHEWETVTQETS